LYQYIILVGEPQGKRLFEIPRCKQQDTIKMGLSIIDDKGVDWLKLTYYFITQILLKTAINLVASLGRVLS